ncbi:unnamed protein product, partial [Polarella glacialis]
YLQIYDSGHLVPMDQPEASLAMVREFISPKSRWAPSTLSALTQGQGSSAKLDIYGIRVCGAIAVTLVGSMLLVFRFTGCARRAQDLRRDDAYMALS